MRNWRPLIIFAAIVVLVGVGWVVADNLSKRIKTTPPEAEAPAEVEVPTAVEKTPETSKVVLEETKTQSGETFKAVSGKLVSVSDRTLVLEVEGDRLQVSVSPNAKITRTVLPSGAGSPQATSITLEQLQIGEKVDALVKIEGGQTVANNVNVIVGP